MVQLQPALTLQLNKFNSDRQVTSYNGNSYRYYKISNQSLEKGSRSGPLHIDIYENVCIMWCHFWKMFHNSLEMLHPGNLSQFLWFLSWENLFWKRNHVHTDCLPGYCFKPHQSKWLRELYHDTFWDFGKQKIWFHLLSILRSANVVRGELKPFAELHKKLLTNWHQVFSRSFHFIRICQMKI